MSPPSRIAVLGGGLSGLTTAYHLSKSLPSSSKITLIEASPRIGGWINSKQHQVGFKDDKGEIVEGSVTLESGPRSIRPRGSKGAAGMLRMLRDLDLVKDIIPIPFSHPAAKNRYLLNTSTSEISALPSSPLSLLQTQSPLLKGLLPSILGEPFRSRFKEGSSSSSSSELGTGIGANNDESVDSFFSRRFSPSIAKNLASAMVHGIYAASSKELSVRAAFPTLWDSEQKFGSVVLGMLRGGTKTRREKEEEKNEWLELGELGGKREKWSLYGIKGGLGSLTNSLHQEIINNGVEIRTEESIERIDPSASAASSSSSSSSQAIQIKTSKGNLETDHIISALSPLTLSKLLPSEPSSSSSTSLYLPHLDANPYTSVGVVNLVYPLSSDRVHPEGFGYLIPRSTATQNPNGVLGVIFDSTAIPLQSDCKGVTKLTIMLGGPYWSTYKPISKSPPESDEGLIQNAIDHLNIVFPHLKNIEPIIKTGKIHWNCIPTYLPGHGDRLKELNESINNGIWKNKLSLVGNGYGGVGVNDCVYSAENVVNALKQGNRVTGLERWKDWN
ncbi:protoporphyrinogen oxidase [Kwoniella shivajii]|uniref:Protoporphyrinogen oxidase n=1 Tax=Kwoniella shivajii TaxID=564305 RepID=A0ABZ1DAL6_9TREE|nr:protoporphyrinogen oxidase [Kwoniella shivajii]